MDTREQCTRCGMVAMIRTARAWQRTLSIGDCMILLAGRHWPTGQPMHEDDALLMARILARRLRITPNDVKALFR